MLAATKVKMSGSEKKKHEQEHVRHFLHKTCNQEVSGSFKVILQGTTRNNDFSAIQRCNAGTML